MKGMDPRAARTQALLRAAIMQLASQRPVAEITVKEIIEQAGVNRSSFYQHFDSREELLASSLEHIETEMARADEPVVVTDLSTPPAELERFMRHFAEHADLYRLVFSSRGSALVVSRVRARIIALVRSGMIASNQHQPLEHGIAQHPELPLDIAAAGTAGALLGIIEAWLSQDPLPEPHVAALWAWQMFLRQD